MVDKKTIIIPNLRFLVNTIEKRMKREASLGWRLIKQERWSFTFIKCKPFDADYFMFNNPSRRVDRGGDYHNIQYIYGLSNSKSLLNKSNCDLIEIDINTINDMYYVSKKSGNRYYLKHYVISFVTFLVFLVASLLLFGIIDSVFSTIISSALILCCVYEAIAIMVLYKNRNEVK